MGEGNMIDTHNVNEVMLKAADVMQTRGHNNYAQEGLDGTVCVLGAIFLALGQQPYIASCEQPILNAIQQRLGLVAESTRASTAAWALAEWSNDADGPTVIAALRKAASQS